MTVFDDFLLAIDNPTHRQKLHDVFDWIHETYPKLVGEIKWNQPMFTHHGTFIIAFSVAKKHFSIAPEKATMIAFKERIDASGYGQSMMLFRIKWTDEIDYPLLRDMIDTNIREKAETTSFWR
ncbi:iron chaperone [Candidatus Xianfuyuplasma coldseepsis]|uniref:Iron chaperone n=1 Tax=Candidatus Xianfuyuplasma coldseepsis TaxID=2782163 RepID=A0A7L7KQ53_9MOLU|nr:DUF1801 domain-containing protein [Xianfuyuplasma coldseepsis]QMS84392.1 iron chaperone [Xianfuyuplasma coldseepsis]